jgi:LmbE family N-acetylglucosaminyl deacetylase
MPKVLAAFAHPDDMELLCAGTLRLLVEAGWEMCCLTLSGGDRANLPWTREEIRRVRLREAQNGAAVLGGKAHWAGLDDIGIFYCREQLEIVVEAVRRFSPDLILTHSPDCYTLDHEETSRLARMAAFACKNYHFETRSPAMKHGPHLYYTDASEGKDKYGHPVRADFWIDVTPVFALRQKALACHESQCGGKPTPENIRMFQEMNERRARRQGEYCGVDYAEGFRQNLAHNYPQDDILGAVLSGFVKRPGEAGNL